MEIGLLHVVSRSLKKILAQRLSVKLFIFVGVLLFAAEAFSGTAETAGAEKPGVSSAAKAPVPLTVMVDNLGALTVGQDAPPFGAQLVDGKVVGLRQLIYPEGIASRPRVLIISFFTTVCQPCLVGLKAITAAAADIRWMNTEILLVAAGERDAKVSSYMKRIKSSLPVFADSFQAVAELYSVVGPDGQICVPVTVVVDVRGKIAALITEEGPDYIEILKREVRSAGMAKP